MARENVPVPTCALCPCHLVFSGKTPVYQNGVTMHSGERYCTGFKKARRFRRGDPKVYVPSWCPKRKTPCELRVYCFKSNDDAWLHNRLILDMGRAISPEARRYAVLYELETDLTPKEFWRRCNRESDAAVVGAAVHLYYVVEVDDGIAPVCFYKTRDGYTVIRGFDTEKARKNVRQK